MLQIRKSDFRTIHIPRSHEWYHVSRIDQIWGLFCRILSLLYGSFAKETYYLTHVNEWYDDLLHEHHPATLSPGACIHVCIYVCMDKYIHVDIENMENIVWQVPCPSHTCPPPAPATILSFHPATLLPRACMHVNLCVYVCVCLCIYVENV